MSQDGRTFQRASSPQTTERWQDIEFGISRFDFSRQGARAIRLVLPDKVLGAPAGSIQIGNILVRAAAVSTTPTPTPTSTPRPTATPTPRPTLPPVSCSDSDGGRNYYTAGTVTAGSVTYKDLCYQAKSRIVEYRCENGVARAEWHNCESGCRSGACLRANTANKCSDSDGGKNYTVRGSVNLNGKTYSDLCYQADKKIFEYYCNADGTMGGEWRGCANGCNIGACL